LSGNQRSQDVKKAPLLSARGFEVCWYLDIQLGAGALPIDQPK